MKFRYDFHIHSALSPCAEKEMTPNNIVNMAVLNGLDLIAVTDHNAAGNLGAIEKCARRKNLVLVPGIEVESQEEVHVICLFPDVESATEMGEMVKVHLPALENREEVLGTQYLFDEWDRMVGKEERMLLFSTDLTVEAIFLATKNLGGYAYFAHVDRSSYSVFSALGTLPSSVTGQVIEVSDTDAGRKFASERRELQGKQILFSSDSHRLKAISRSGNFISLSAQRGEITARDVINWMNEKDMR